MNTVFSLSWPQRINSHLNIKKSCSCVNSSCLLEKHVVYIQYSFRFPMPENNFGTVPLKRTYSVHGTICFSRISHPRFLKAEAASLLARQSFLFLKQEHQSLELVSRIQIKFKMNTTTAHNFRAQGSSHQQENCNKYTWSSFCQVHKLSIDFLYGEGEYFSQHA